jgi:hypothetical protein
VQPGDLQAKGSDGLRADRADKVVQLGAIASRRGRCGRRSAPGVGGEDLLHRPPPGPVLHPPQRRREVSRSATSAQMTCPWVNVATSRIGQARSIIPARSSRWQKLAPTGSAPSTFSTLGGP